MAEQEHTAIPAIAKSAIALAQQEYNRITETLAIQTLDAMGLDRKDGWKVDCANGVAFRDVPEQAGPALVEDQAG